MARHRIHELFSEEMLDEIVKIQRNPEFTNNNEKVEAIKSLLADSGFTEIGPGTNRLCMRHIDYVYKIALDSYGVRDNWNEFNMSPELQPYVTKTYECNGIVAVAEYVDLVNKTEFHDSIQNIKNILELLSEDYIFCDISLKGRNALNFGFRPNGSIVILDYGLT